MGPTPAAALGTRSAHPDALGFSRGKGGEPPAGMLPQPRTPAAPPRGDAAQSSPAGFMGRREWAAGFFCLAGGPYGRAGSLLIVPCPPAGCSQFLLPAGFFQAGSGCCSSKTLQHSQGDRTCPLFQPTNSVLHLNNPQPAFLPAWERPEPRGSEPGRGGASASPSPLYRSSTLQLARRE